jgi:hypothetical protein
MNDADRVKLLGNYWTPGFRVGQSVRGNVIVVGLSETSIPWPVFKVGKWLQDKKQGVNCVDTSARSIHGMAKPSSSSRHIPVQIPLGG